MNGDIFFNIIEVYQLIYILSKILSTNKNQATEQIKPPTESGTVNSNSKTRSYVVKLLYVKRLTDPLRRLYKQYVVNSYVIKVVLTHCDSS